MGKENTIKQYTNEIVILAGSIISRRFHSVYITFYLRRQYLTFWCGLHTYQRILVELEGPVASCTASTLTVWICQRQHVIVVAQATPAPVHMEEPVTIVAVDNKLVASDA